MFQGKREKVVTTYGDLVDGEHIVDKSGNEWVVLNLDNHETTNSFGEEVSFSLADILTPQLAAHTLTKPTGDPVTVLRKETQAQEVERREAEVDEAAAPTTPDEPEPTPEESVAAVEEGLGGEVIVEETVPEREAREEAEETGEPVELPDFHELSDLEKRSHLYLLHGVYAQDVRFRDALNVMHKELHDDPEQRFVPHVHVRGAKVPTSDDAR